MSYTFVKVGRARNSSGEGEHWRDEHVAPTVNLFDLGDARTVVAIVSSARSCTSESNHFPAQQRKENNNL